MNKRDLMFQRNNVKREYHSPGSTETTPVKTNALFIRPNSYEHEKAKFDKCYEMTVAGEHFITEAKEKSSGLIRDVVSLDTGEIFEFEICSKRALRFKGQDGVEVVMVESDLSSLSHGQPPNYTQ